MKWFLIVPAVVGAAFCTALAFVAGMLIQRWGL